MCLTVRGGVCLGLRLNVQLGIGKNVSELADANSDTARKTRV